MKNSFTSVFYAKTLALSLFFAAPMVTTGQVLFTQNFSSNTGETPSTYIGTGEHQFDFLGATATTTAGAATTSLVRVFNVDYPNKVRLTRGNTSIAFAKTTPFVNNATPSFLKIKFKLSVVSTGGTSTTAAVFYVGDGLSADAVGNEGAKSHSRLEVGFATISSTAPTFTIRNGTSVSATTYTGGSTAYDITWYINNSGASMFYKDPMNMDVALADDKADIWVGTTRILNNIEATTIDKPLTDFKFLVATAGTVVLDDIEVSGPTGVVLPVSLTNFTAKKAATTNQLTWATESETNNKGYNVERKTATGEWLSLGFVNGTGKAATYTFEDRTPLSISYYRLRQVDFDGTETLSKIVSVSQDTKGRLNITPNPTSDKVNINFNQNDGANATTTIVLHDMTGRQVLTQVTTAGTFQLDMSNLAKGMYVVTVQSNNAIYQEKIIRQ